MRIDSLYKFEWPIKLNFKPLCQIKLAELKKIDWSTHCHLLDVYNVKFIDIYDLTQQCMLTQSHESC